jgi:hypothetical protein
VSKQSATVGAAGAGGAQVMRRLVTIAAIVLAGAVTAHGADVDSRFNLELEVGPVWQSKNDVQIPNDDRGTRFSLQELVGSGPWASARFYFTWNITQRHGVRVLLAPLSYTETGIFDSAVDFDGETFAPDVPTEATYQFNSWRVTYRYRFHSGERWRWWVGFTAKIRDAKIRLEQGTTASEDTDVGFVPLAHLRGDFRFAARWHFLLDVDALAGGPGRAVDLALKVGYDVSDRWGVTGGYRTVEGGADVDRVYNFAWFNYAVFSAVYRF